MNLLTTAFTAVCAVGAGLVIPACAAGQAASREGGIAVPATPASIKGILAAQRFTLDTPYRYTWTKEPRMVSTGVLVVLDVDPAYVVPRNNLEPVLYAGNVAVHRLNHGHLSGRVIGIVPGNIDLATAPIWFGSPGLPERLTEDIVTSERDRAVKAGVRTLPAAKVADAQRPPVTAKDLASLLRTVAADLVLEFSPQEKDLVDSWRLPVAKAPPSKRPNPS